jgi:hypothetical protein
MTKATLIKDNI